jgi:beta-lactamase family protein
MDSLLERYAAFGYAGVALVEYRGRFVLHRAYGMADRERGIANRIDTRFAIASITKGLTAAAVLRLAERSALRTGDSLARWFTGLPPDVARITIDQMLDRADGDSPPATEPPSAEIPQLAVRPVESSATGGMDDPRAKVTPLAPGRIGWQFTTGQDTQDLFREVQDLLGHEVPPGDVEAVLNFALRAGKEKLERRKATIGNVRLLCRAHNQYEAERTYVAAAGYVRCFFFSAAGNSTLLRISR